MWLRPNHEFILSEMKRSVMKSKNPEAEPVVVLRGPSASLGMTVEDDVNEI